MSDYIGHRPKECCDRGYYDGSKGWWCCGNRHEREMHQLRAALALSRRAGGEMRRALEDMYTCLNNRILGSNGDPSKDSHLRKQCLKACEQTRAVLSSIPEEK